MAGPVPTTISSRSEIEGLLFVGLLMYAIELMQRTHLYGSTVHSFKGFDISAILHSVAAVAAIVGALLAAGALGMILFAQAKVTETNPGGWKTVMTTSWPVLLCIAVILAQIGFLLHALVKNHKAIAYRWNYWVAVFFLLAFSLLKMNLQTLPIELLVAAIVFSTIFSFPVTFFDFYGMIPFVAKSDIAIALLSAITLLMMCGAIGLLYYYGSKYANHQIATQGIAALLLGMYCVRSITIDWSTSFWALAIFGMTFLCVLIPDQWKSESAGTAILLIGGFLILFALAKDAREGLTPAVTWSSLYKTESRVNQRNYPRGYRIEVTTSDGARLHFQMVIPQQLGRPEKIAADVVLGRSIRTFHRVERIVGDIAARPVRTAWKMVTLSNDAMVNGVSIIRAADPRRFRLIDEISS